MRNYTHARLFISKKRDNTTPELQLSSIRFLDSSNNLYLYASDAVCTLSVSNVSYNPGEGPASLIDNSTDTKMCILNYNTFIGYNQFYIKIDFGSKPLDIDTYVKWQWCTANDTEGRDPVSFQFEISSDGGKTFELVSSEQDFNTTTTRKVAAYTGNMPSSIVGYYKCNNSDTPVVPAYSFVPFGDDLYIGDPGQIDYVRRSTIAIKTLSSRLNIAILNPDTTTHSVIYNEGDGTGRVLHFSPTSELYTYLTGKTHFGIDWRDAVVGDTLVYEYENDALSGVPLPSPYCTVFVTKSSSGRGIAFAFTWNAGDGNYFWTNRLHDSWQGWVQMLP